MTQQGTLKPVPLTEIRESPAALRKVDRTSEEYLGLVDSIRATGVLNPILIREFKDEESGDEGFMLVDGLHRFTAAQDAGLEEIPAQVYSISEAEALSAQIMTNVHRIETKPVEYSKQLQRVLAGDPLMTINELAQSLAKSPTWINSRLGLLKLTEEIGKLVDDDKINLSNAYALAKLPKDEQNDWVDRAMTDQPNVFMPAVNARRKELRDAARQGKDAKPAEFQAVAHMQKLRDIKDERDNSQISASVLSSVGASSAQDGWNACLDWVLHLDPQSVTAQKVQQEQRDKEKGEATQRRAAERADKKAKDAAAKAVELKEEAEKANTAVNG